MKSINIDLNNITAKDFDIIKTSLKAGKIAVLPTDTVYGLSAIAANADALSKIYKIKQRTSSQKKFLILLVSNFKMIKQYCKVSQKQQGYLEREWQKERALTVILDSKPTISTNITSDSNGISVRLPNNSFLLKLISTIDIPIVSTSLNITGQPVLEDLTQINNYFTKQKPDLVVNVDLLPKKQPSKIIDIRDLDNIKIIRK